MTPEEKRAADAEAGNRFSRNVILVSTIVGIIGAILVIVLMRK
jgi:hypothetical protein